MGQSHQSVAPVMGGMMFSKELKKHREVDAQLITTKMKKVFNHVAVDLGYDELSAETKKSIRKYTTPEGAEYPSITTVLGFRDRGKWAKWRKDIGEENANRITRRACGAGTAVHNIAERYINNEEEIFKTQNDEMPHIQFSWNILKNVIDECVGKVYMQECTLYSDKLKVAGRVDCIAEFNGEISIIDFKTSSRVKTEDEIETYFMQECAYAIMFEEHTGIKIENLVTAMVVNENPKPVIFIQKRKKWEERLQNEIKFYYDNSY